MTRAGDQSLVSNATRNRLRGFAVPFATALGRLGLTPNGLTVIGFAGTCGAAVAAGVQAWLLAGVLVIAFGIFDLFDGALARATGRASQFGAFLDSTLDRTGESLVLAGVAYACASVGFAVGAGLAASAIAFASVVTYARAKAEGLGLKGDGGIAQRPERLVILAVGLIGCGLLGGLEPATGAGGSWGNVLGTWPSGGGTTLLAAALGLSFRDYVLRHPSQPALLIEVSDSSLALDRHHKGSLYARAGVADYWIVNLIDGVLEVCREPGPDELAPFGWRFRRLAVLGREASVSPLALVGASIRVADLLPPA